MTEAVGEFRRLAARAKHETKKRAVTKLGATVVLADARCVCCLRFESNSWAMLVRPSYSCCSVLDSWTM
jgi:hypothetical protein